MTLESRHIKESLTGDDGEYGTEEVIFEYEIPQDEYWYIEGCQIHSKYTANSGNTGFDFICFVDNSPKPELDDILPREPDLLENTYRSTRLSMEQRAGDTDYGSIDGYAEGGETIHIVLVTMPESWNSDDRLDIEIVARRIL